VAKAIGWPTSRFQWEVGLAGVGYGVAGGMAPAFDRGFWLATIIVFSTFMLGAAVGHVRSYRRAQFRAWQCGLHLLVRHPGAGLPGCYVRCDALTTR
jgi:Family of unknown function (DUF6790)